ncbi:MAG: substrate-binding domain-containing protein, partial [Kiritimatiellia bacterium]|nr:substrate-binding domain-containing protein [Kiritimatiellia bacterium]
MVVQRKRSQPIFRIAVTLPHSMFSRAAIDGLLRFAKDRPKWLFRLGDLSAPEVRLDVLDALVGVLYDRRTARKYAGLGAPMISVFRKPAGLEIPSILIDHEAVGRMAADYFIQKGLSNLAYLGRPSIIPSPRKRLLSDPVSEGRRRGFAHACRTAGIQAILAPAYSPWQNNSFKSLKSWLHALPKPTGLFCIADPVAQWISGICRIENIAVPDQIAILGVDNDERMCDLSPTPLSSIAIPWERVGEEIGKRLDTLFETGKMSTETEWIQPERVVERASTESGPNGLFLVARVRRHLREHALSPTNLKEIMASFPEGRRRIERLYRAHTGHTLLDELAQMRIERATHLLNATAWPLSRIAVSCGFTNLRSMDRAFLAITG